MPGVKSNTIDMVHYPSQDATNPQQLDTFLDLLLKRSVQDLNGAGAVNLTTLTTKWGTTGAQAGTLADGSEGQIKFIMMDADGGDGTLTPTNFGNGTTITFNDVGDSVILQFLGSDWWVMANNGCTVA